MSPEPLTESMRAALSVLRDGRWHANGYRGVRVNTLEALERRRLVECRTVWPGARLEARITNTGYAKVAR